MPIYHRLKIIAYGAAADSIQKSILLCKSKDKKIARMLRDEFKDKIELHKKIAKEVKK